MNDTLDYDTLNPGIRATVKWLRAYGFATSSSGDGVTHECPECDAGWPYVTMLVKPKHLIRETRALVDLLDDMGIPIGEMTEDGPQGVCVQAGYEPVSDTAWITLDGLDDAALRRALEMEVASYFDEPVREKEAA